MHMCKAVLTCRRGLGKAVQPLRHEAGGQAVRHRTVRQVSQRMAQRGQLPVQHPQHLPGLAGVEQQVVQPACCWPEFRGCLRIMTSGLVLTPRRALSHVKTVDE